jgi:hypothetical protein
VIGHEQWFASIEHVTFFSDTIMMFSQDDSLESFFAICHFSNTIFRLFLSHRLALRGGIALGEVVLNPEQGLFVGPAIVTAHELEGSIDALGVCISPEVPVESLPASIAVTRLTIPRQIKNDGGTRRSESTDLFVPTAGFRIQGVAEEDWPGIFSELRDQAGEQFALRYANSEEIVAAMLNIDEGLLAQA